MPYQGLRYDNENDLPLKLLIIHKSSISRFMAETLELPVCQSLGETNLLAFSSNR